MGGVLILALLISRCSEQQTVKWEVNKQIRRLKSKNPDVRVDAAEALDQIGSDAKVAVPALQALKDETDYESYLIWDRGRRLEGREYAAKALEKINIEAEATENAEFDF